MGYVTANIFITGCWASLLPVILVDLLGIEVIEKSLGQCLAAGSIAFLVASPMSGKFPNNYKSVIYTKLKKLLNTRVASSKDGNLQSDCVLVPHEELQRSTS